MEKIEVGRGVEEEEEEHDHGERRLFGFDGFARMKKRRRSRRRKSHTLS